MAEIRAATIDDLPRVADLIREFSEFERLSDSCRISVAALADALFDDDTGFTCMVAAENGDVVGYVLYYPVFRTFSGEKALYIEDLYVVPAEHGRGIGIGLMQAVARDAASRGVRRLDWQVLKWNSEAIGFYEALGAIGADDNLDFRLNGEAFDRIAE